MKPNVIKGKQLIKQIAEDSGYLQYEVQDILQSLACCLAENASAGYSTVVKGIGSFNIKKGYSMKGVSNLTGTEYDIITPTVLSLKTDKFMQNSLNEELLTQNSLNSEVHHNTPEGYNDEPAK